MESSRPVQVSGCTLESLRVTSNLPLSTSAHLIPQKPQRKSWRAVRKESGKCKVKQQSVRYDFIHIGLDIHQVSKHQSWQGWGKGALRLLDDT